MIFNLGCKKHLKYEGQRWPKSMCEACRAIYWLRHDGFRKQEDGSMLLDTDSKKNGVKKKKTPGIAA